MAKKRTQPKKGVKTPIKKSAKKPGRMSKYLILGSLVSVLLGTAVFLYANQPEPVRPGNGELATPVSEYDFGYVSVKKGKVSTEVPLVNIGKEDLTITFIDTSCGCTSAQVINNGEEGPIFSMAMTPNAQSSSSWRTVIKPGKKASLRIYYDPNVHKNLRGQVIRVVKITTNEKIYSIKEIRVKVNQVG